tara:strand:- start:380 stop:571 length:192 start_codon:yes stop_codon:yes gene_type:complete
MNLKERGITVGDLLIILIAIISTSILVKNLNKDKKATINFSNQDDVSYNIILLSKNHLQNISV